jgi:hypothetical protein
VPAMALEQASTPETLVYELLHRFLGVPRAFLNPANQLVFTAFLVSEVVIRQLCVFLFKFSFGDIPIALDMECVHFNVPFSVLFMLICFLPQP